LKKRARLILKNIIRQWPLKLAALSVAALPTIVHATWSVVAVDAETGEVGAAGATCWPSVAVIARVVSGKGAVVAQGLTSNEGRDQASRMLREGNPANSVVEAITSTTVDQSFVVIRQLRQYGVASLQSGKASVASFTGIFTSPSSGSREAVGVSVQGNILRSDAVLDKTLEDFQNTPKSCGLAVALLNALEAGAREGGDARCSTEQSALSAFLFLARPTDAANALTVRVVAPDQKPGEKNPVLMLREQLRNRMAEKSILPSDCSF
jgi:uncharacterized Ntn-hydrolase superfamily protein